MPDSSRTRLLTTVHRVNRGSLSRHQAVPPTALGAKTLPPSAAPSMPLIKVIYGGTVSRPSRRFAGLRER